MAFLVMKLRSPDHHHFAQMQEEAWQKMVKLLCHILVFFGGMCPQHMWGSLELRYVGIPGRWEMGKRPSVKVARRGQEHRKRMRSPEQSSQGEIPMNAESPIDFKNAKMLFYAVLSFPPHSQSLGRNLLNPRALCFWWFREWRMGELSIIFGRVQEFL